MGFLSDYKQKKQHQKTIKNQEENQKLIVNCILAIEKEDDWKVIADVLSDRNLDISTGTLLTIKEIYKQYLVASAGRVDPKPNMRQVINSSNLVAMNLMENSRILASGGEVKSDLRAEDDRFLLAHAMKAIVRSDNEEGFKKAYKYANAVSDSLSRIVNLQFLHYTYKIYKKHPEATPKQVLSAVLAQRAEHQRA